MNSDTQIRRKMIEELIKEVRGPRYGENEIISYSPWIEYLTGVIIPKSWEETDSDKSPDQEIIIETDDVAQEDGSETDDILTATPSNKLTPKSFIKSFGVSFSIEIENPTLKICSTWGRYLKDSEHNEAYGLNGKKNSVSSDKDIWQRHSFGEIFEIEVNEQDVDDDTINKEFDGRELVITKTLENYESEIELDDEGYVKIYIKRLKVSDDNYSISVYMINDLSYDVEGNESQPNIDKCLFQPSIRIICEDGIRAQHMELLNESERKLDFLYRNRPTIAFGHMCSAVWKKIDYFDKFDIDILWPDYSIRLLKNNDYEKFLKSDVRTEFVPLYPIALPKLDLIENELLVNDELNAEYLANCSPNEIHGILIKLLKLYNDWIEENESEPIGEKYLNIAKEILEIEYDASNRMERGLNLIKTNPLIYTAFCFANKAIALQNTWGKYDGAEFKWRPFQIAFFLMNIEDIWDENSDNRDILDLLWIPTGGGKTEAYLGIMAFTIALRRLKAHDKNETGAGTSIISRYTLRLLTVQQFRRTLKMITAAEFLRTHCSDKGIGWRPNYSEIIGDWIYGSTRFSTGLWVGGGVSPIHLLKKGGAMDLLKGNDVRLPYTVGEPAQILKCPVCGSWLSVPESGLNDELNNVHIVIKSTEYMAHVEEILDEIFVNNEKINFVGIESKNHLDGFYTISFEIHGKFSRIQFENEIIDKLKENGFEIASLGDFNIGYFTSLNSIDKYGNKIEGDFDFEIWCTNPKCDLNNVEWFEGCPYPNSSEPHFPDGNYNRKIVSPFISNTRMPIPAYLIDDHVYNRCPTVVIGTADKIARLAFEPKAGGLFGNINYFNKYYGYNRNNLLPDTSGNLTKYNHEVNSLNPPDLIIQDELHLIDGPLGSLFGLYESMVSGIIQKQGGNPKYIASTATISNASKQVDLLFSKKLFQFPPHGLDISDNFFVRDHMFNDIWDESKAGRVYLGFYAPGKGPMTPQVRLWSRMSKVSSDNTDNDNINNYWTTLGYFNSIKELGGVLALYRDDIKSRLENIGGNIELKQLGEDNKEELSGRKSSTELPMILDNLERDSFNHPPKYDGIFTTSMFGTGVDISHLSLMVMTSQPKTTGSYIQATGRIGRKYGGLVVDFFKAGRSRDLNHYEMFTSFHSRIYMDVEPVSVSPFSSGCLSRGLGPSLVSFLRNANHLMVNWEKNDGKEPIKNINSINDYNDVYNIIKMRLNSIDNINEDSVKKVLKNLDKCWNDWEFIADNIESKRLLRINEYYIKKPQHHVVLGDEGHKYDKNLKVVFKDAPQSLRDVEETIDFWV
ncbi:DISARM system helicase DrmA [Methanobrevibacter millerae]|uniref:Helicase domain-containing protein n=1 Tax=Methanobrevibacter millerae TaxID=230361 RepID=A0A0U3EBJ2_9EURY|nr:DISARM system helicase DrmA [Methanobrevibacter millerae]ALT68977.1 helicase domain-containing protein [Methanobrevibacter millerae]